MSAMSTKAKTEKEQLTKCLGHQKLLQYVADIKDSNPGQITRFGKIKNKSKLLNKYSHV